MSKLVNFDYEGFAVTFKDDGWFSATSVAKQFGKEPSDWLSQKENLAYVIALCKNQGNFNDLWQRDINKINSLDSNSAVYKSSVLSLTKKTPFVKVKMGSPENGGGTWLHPKLAIAFARWLSVDFAVWCDMQIENLIKGKSAFKFSRHQASVTYHVMTEMIQTKREYEGKDVCPHHFSNEALMINEAMFGIRAKINRDRLSPKELDLIAFIEKKNTALIGMGLSYDDRKVKIKEYADNWRLKHSFPLVIEDCTRLIEQD